MNGIIQLHFSQSATLMHDIHHINRFETIIVEYLKSHAAEIKISVPYKL